MTDLTIRDKHTKCVKRDLSLAIKMIMYTLPFDYDSQPLLSHADKTNFWYGVFKNNEINRELKT